MATEHLEAVPCTHRLNVRVLLKALMRLGQSPRVRQYRISSLTKAVRQNRYRIDCRKLADCLIAALLFGL